MDDTSNFLLNTALILALTPILAVVGQGLKVITLFKTVPELLPLVNAVIGLVLAVWITIARNWGLSFGPTAMELTIAALSGGMAGYASGKAHDAAVMLWSQRPGPKQTRHARRIAPH